MIFFTENLNNKLNIFVNTIDNKILKKFTIGFYQLLNKEINHNIDIEELLRFLEKTTSIRNEVLKSTPSEEIAFFLTYIAHMYASIMMIEKSLDFYKESINIRENLLEIKSLATAENYQGMGVVYEQSEAFDSALVYYQKALALRKELSYVQNNLLIAESYSRLALVYYHLEYYKLALGYIEETIRIRERLLPSEHVLLENSYYNYKQIYKETQPHKDYLRIIIEPVYQVIGAIISRIVTFK